MTITKQQVIDQLRDIHGTAGAMLVVREIRGIQGMTAGNWEDLRRAVSRAHLLLLAIDGPKQIMKAQPQEGRKA